MPTSSIPADPSVPTSAVKRPALSMPVVFVLSIACSLPAVIVLACWLAELLPSPSMWFAITIPLFFIGQALRIWWECRFAGNASKPVAPTSAR